VTGYGTFSLAIPHLPAAGVPTVSEFGWAIVIGLVAAPVCVGLRRLAVPLSGRVRSRPVSLTVASGLVIAALAIGYAEISGHAVSDVLFSGEDQLPGLIEGQGGYTVAALLVLLVCKGLAYVAALSAFRGGPTFPALFLGAAGGIALSHLPGLALVPAIAMGMAAMTAAMLKLPMTAVLITTLFLGSDGFPVIPLTIVAVVVAYVAQVWLGPEPAAPVPDAVPSDPALAASPVLPEPRRAGPAPEGARPDQRLGRGLHRHSR
jgi:H+/Cl- antiporter ClcA